MAYLLDTNSLSDAIRRPRGTVAARIHLLSADEVFTSIVVASELRFGAIKAGSRRLASLIDELLMRVRVLPLGIPSDEHYGHLRTALQRAGKLIGANDMLIAAHALSLNACVVTDNITEFQRVPGLKVENWLR